jgi:hypothetical protein
MIFNGDNKKSLKRMRANNRLLLLFAVGEIKYFTE